MSNDSNSNKSEFYINMPMCSNKLSEFEPIRTEPAKPNTLEPSQIRSSRVSRMCGVECSVYFEQPLRAYLLLLIVQCFCFCVFFIKYGFFSHLQWVLKKQQ